MRLAACVIVALFFCGFAKASDESVDDKDVLVLTEKNFDEIVNSKDLILVEFYAPWCGHCKHLAPEYAKAATQLLQNDPPIPLAKVDATKESKLGGRFSVSGYPTLKVFRNGKDSEYKGPRQTAGIVAYMKKQVGPAAKLLDSAADVEKLTKSDPETGFAVVGFFDQARSKTSQLQSSFALVANKLRDSFVFGKTFDASAAKHFGAEPDQLVAFKDFDDKKTVYKGETTTKAVEEWIRQNSLPLIGEWTEDKADLYNKRELPIAKFFTSVERSKNQKQFDYYMNRLKKAAEENRAKIITSFVLMSKNERLVGDYGLTGKEWGLVIEKGYTDKFKMDGNKFTADLVQQFYADYLAGNLEKFVKSQDIPEKNDGPVKVVVGKTFDKIVNDPEKDVFIEFYAPWCGHCKTLEPKYDELARKLKHNDGLVIAKIDATANDYSKEYEVSGFPTIYFKPAKAGAKPIKYEDDREVDDMMEFIKRKAKNPIEGGKKKKKNKTDL